MEEMVKEVLAYIEKESADWDAEDLGTGGLFQVFQYIQEAVCKALFIHMHREMEDLPEELLREESIYFYYDCIQVMFAKCTSIKNEEIGGGEINYYQFYDRFVKFIKCIQEMKISKNMGKEVNQLYKLLEIAFFEEIDIPEDAAGNVVLRYIENGDGSVDIQNQTKRFWVKWIVEEKSVNISMEKLLSKNMKEEELVFWLLIASIINFSDSFGDGEMKELKKCLIYTRDAGKKDVSKVLHWCFHCWFDLVRYGDNSLKEFIQETGDIFGMVALAKRFDYQIWGIKRQLRKEVEGLFNQPQKIFTTRYANNVVCQIELKSLNTLIPFIGKKEPMGYVSVDYRYIIRYLRDIWEDFDNKWFDSKSYIEANSEKEADISQIELEIFDQDIQVNKFFAYEFIKLSVLEKYNFTNLFLAEKHLFFSQLEDLMFNGDMSLEEICTGIIQLAQLKEGGRMDNMENDSGEDSEQEEDEECNSSERILEQEQNLLKIYGKVLKDEVNYIQLYCEVVNSLAERKKIKIAKKLSQKLLLGIEQDEFCVGEGDYISWENISQSKIEEIFGLSICQTVIESYCFDLEFTA